MILLMNFDNNIYPHYPCVNTSRCKEKIEMSYFIVASDERDKKTILSRQCAMTERE